jgi:hypothetical protein
LREAGWRHSLGKPHNSLAKRYVKQGQVHFDPQYKKANRDIPHSTGKQQRTYKVLCQYMVDYTSDVTPC